MNKNSNTKTLDTYLSELSDQINKLYGYVKIAGDNFGEPAINSGPCGPFANAFFKLWNLKFTKKVNIVFIMVKNSDECWHVLIRLPNGSLYDGGHGVHSEEMYSDEFDIEDMIEYDINLLEKHSCGLDREYPRYCPSFSIHAVEDLIEKYLNLIQKNVTFEKITPEQAWHANAPLISLYRQAEDYFFRGISSKCLNLDDGAYAYMTGGAGLNFIYITRNTNILDKILIQGKQFYYQDNLSFEVIIPQKLCSPQIVGILNTLGYPQKSKSVSMVMNLDTFAIDKTASFDAKTIIKANDDQLNDWMMPLIGAFESTYEICSMYANVHKQALKKNINLLHFSLYKQDKPIASITLSMNNNIARIDDVGTLPEFQGKGYATHLMSYVLSEAKRLGARHCFLESSDSGLRVYQKLGFEPLFKNNIYMRKA